MAAATTTMEAQETGDGFFGWRVFGQSWSRSRLVYYLLQRKRLEIWESGHTKPVSRTWFIVSALSLKCGRRQVQRLRAILAERYRMRLN